MRDTHQHRLYVAHPMVLNHKTSERCLPSLSPLVFASTKRWLFHLLQNNSMPFLLSSLRFSARSACCRRKQGRWWSTVGSGWSAFVDRFLRHAIRIRASLGLSLYCLIDHALAADSRGYQPSVHSLTTTFNTYSSVFWCTPGTLSRNDRLRLRY